MQAVEIVNYALWQLSQNTNYVHAYIMTILYMWIDYIYQHC